MRPSTKDQPTYPEVEERIGEDPARFLATDMDVKPMLRGMVDLGRANAWLQVAREMDVREGTKRAIEQRRDELLEADT